MSTRSISLAIAAIAVIIAPGALGAPKPASEYTLVELSGTEGADTGAIQGSSKTASQFRVGGGALVRTYGTNCSQYRAAYWDVTGTSSPVDPTLLPSVRPDRTSRVNDVSDDGSALGGADYDSEDGVTANGCVIQQYRPAIWVKNALNEWVEILLPQPDGHVDGQVMGLTDDAMVVFGSVVWLFTDPSDLSTQYVRRLVIWRREALGAMTWTPEIISDPAVNTHAQDIDPAGRTASAVIQNAPYYLEDVGLRPWSQHPLHLLSEAACCGGAAPGRYSAFFGNSSTGDNSTPRRAVVWDDAMSVPRDLGTLGGTSLAWASDQASSGTTVGMAPAPGRWAGTNEDRAVKWSPPSWGITDLNSVANTNGWTLWSASCVDDAGRIAGRGKKVVRRVTTTGWWALVPTGN